MRSSRRRNRFRWLRRHAAAKLSALTFIALILLPFTAPFPTYEFDLAHGGPVDALPKDVKAKVDAADALILTSAFAAPIPAGDDPLGDLALRCSPIGKPPLQRTILRL